MASVAAEKAELKEEGIIEAATELAEDPQSKVNPEKIEEVLVKETREAGGVAYQFDSDASPEAKAAAAESVCFRAFRLKSPKKRLVFNGRECAYANRSLGTAIVARV